MKKFPNYFTTIIVIIIWGISLQPVYAQKNSIINSAAEPDYPPFSVVNPKGGIDGFSVELLRAVAKAVYLDVNFFSAPKDQIKKDLAAGKIQVLPLVAKNLENEQIYDFTESYLTFYGSIFVRMGDNRIKTEKDLVDKEIVVLKGDAAEEYVRRENISSRIILVDSFHEAFILLSQGKYDAVVAQRVMGDNLIDTYGIKNVVSTNYRLGGFRQDFAFAVKKGNTDLLVKLDKGLSTVKENGTFVVLYQKWFDKKIHTFNYWSLIFTAGLIFPVFVYFARFHEFTAL